LAARRKRLGCCVEVVGAPTHEAGR
jgi:hypothetical protein